ncbi:MAG: flagellar hook-associated protein FlgK [Bacillota bacterium]
MSLNIFEIGKSALLASRRAMDVTGHNVANAATPGYSRQEAILHPIVQRQAEVSGMGVRVTQIRRLRDFFTDSVLRNETANRAFFAVQKDVIDQIQVMSAESSDSGLRAAIESIWAGWQELSIAPDSEPARSALVETSRSLIDMFRHMSGQLDALQVDIDKNISANVERLNSLTETVAKLNAEIGRAAARKDPMGDLLDRRDLLLDEISEIAGATVTRYSDGTEAVRVTVNGFPVVDRTSSFKLAVDSTDPVQYAWVDAAGDRQIIPSVGGRLGGLATSRDELAGTFRQDLEALLRDIVDTVNTQYALGVNPTTGNPPDPPLFFAVGDPTDYLGTANVAPEIVSDPNRIVVWDGDATAPGNGLNGLAISELLEKAPIDQWTAVIGKLGTKGQKITDGLETQELLVKEIQNRKDSISGVSIDEEMANLIREQHAFNAASRLISTADELLDTVINRMGAGR